MQESKLQKIKVVLGDNLSSVLRYFRYKSKLTVLILKKIDYMLLDKVRKEFCGENFILFTEDDILNGADVFPLQFLHIRNNHILLEGRDYFKKMQIEKKHLKLKLEFELRNKLIYLREQYLTAKKSQDFLSNIFPTLTVFFEGLNFLKDQENEGIEVDLLNIEKSYGLDLQVLKDLKKAEESGFNLSQEKISELIQGVNDVLLTLISKIDKMTN